MAKNTEKNSFLFKELNLKFSKLDILALLATLASGIIIGITVAVLYVGMIYQTTTLMNGGNYEILKEYALMALSLFGFTLLGGIFEKRADEEQPIVRHLFRLSLLFLTSFVCFLMVYSIFPQFPQEFEGYKWVFGVVYFIAVSAFVAPIVGLMYFLIRYYVLKYVLKKNCSKCNKKKPIIDFFKGELLKDGLYDVCAKCRRNNN
ncbi:MAG: hypothetical protein MUO82_03095 [Candidatus Thermoplasmatota archaeon]|nr:hypothetical protein [Candidatus Thermoplasmatota archaeon]